MRDSCADGSWDIFNELIDSTTRGNFGNIGIKNICHSALILTFSNPGMYFDHPEIVPDGLLGDYRFNKSDEPAIRFAGNETEVRALIEGQMMAKRIHAERMGFNLTPETRILVTGGASVNTAILQVVADVFNANVYTQSAANSAAMGGAYRALHLAKGGNETCSFSDLIAPVAEAAKQVATPSKDAHAVKFFLLIIFLHILVNVHFATFNSHSKFI